MLALWIHMIIKIISRLYVSLGKQVIRKVMTELAITGREGVAYDPIQPNPNNDSAITEANNRRN